jgi:hypothetical protein
VVDLVEPRGQLCLLVRGVLGPALAEEAVLHKADQAQNVAMTFYSATSCRR